MRSKSEWIQCPECGLIQKGNPSEATCKNCENEIKDSKALRVLVLSLEKFPYEVMETGEKKKEYRKPTPWIESRLFDKKGNPREYDFVKFTNGYGSNVPSFVCEFKGFTKYQGEPKKETFPNGLIVDVEPGDYIIDLGEIIVTYGGK